MDQHGLSNRIDQLYDIYIYVMVKIGICPGNRARRVEPIGSKIFGPGPDLLSIFGPGTRTRLIKIVRPGPGPGPS
jgi:hypothetical protein